MLSFLVVIIALFIYGLYLYATRKNRIKRVERMRRNHVSFEDKFGKLGSSYTLSWEQLKTITSVSEEEMRKSDEVYLKKVERIRIEKENAKAYEQLKEKYPLGVELYGKRIPSAKHSDYIRDKFEIERLDAVGHVNQRFLKKLDNQKEFATKCRSSLPKGWGCRYYEIPIEHKNEFGDNLQEYPYTILQIFPYAFCKDMTLDYSAFPTYKENYEVLNDYVSCKSSLSKTVFDTIADYVNKLSNEVIVLFAGSLPPQGGGYFEQDGTLNNQYFTYFKTALSQRLILYKDFQLYSSSLVKQKDIVIVEYVTSYDSFVSNCRGYIDKLTLYQGLPRVMYISLFREYSKEEMSVLINAQKQAEKQKEEQARIEAERARAEEERRRQEAERQKNITNSLKLAVSSWGTVPQSDLHHDFLIRYYPTTCDFDATDSEWNDRQLIWSFKNDPNKETRIPHQQALSVLLPKVKNRLDNTFGTLLSNLTLVCIPASSPAKHKARYESFSKQLCDKTGMTNAYSHIVVNEERVARHEGGMAGGTDTITFDNDFFKGKNILLFDDLLTRGDSMRKFGRKLTSLGANVIAGFTLGKTFHNREDSLTGVRSNSTSSANNSRYSYDDDLPF